MDQIIGCAVLSRSKPSQLKMEGRGTKSLLGRLAHGRASVNYAFSCTFAWSLALQPYGRLHRRLNRKHGPITD